MTLYFVQLTLIYAMNFQKMMRSEFEMSMMGELNFFLGLQIKQPANGTMIHQQKYIKELLKRFGMNSAKPIDTPFYPSTRFVMDVGSPSVKEKSYRGMIGRFFTELLVDLTLFSVLVYVRVFSLNLKNHI